ncbi:hypothetical protein DNH61_18535 [Paenibacillus sambharensis]|uniref:Uncharacterized protein n=1 Tax=Paenibacillus sambharensis TaxID=1803190 RepID=A0A2W1L304_9BACL|nr:hypothetical protein [Paenibacillus sambharensis]PZD94398.1 hypothetical protein DNH61_18535 [Paenibacillus sambharensis]
MESRERIERLREVENACYRMCYLLMEDEQQAHEAAKQTLINLYASGAFLAPAAPAARQKLLKQEAIRVCCAMQAGRSRIGA